MTQILNHNPNPMIEIPEQTLKKILTLAYIEGGKLIAEAIRDGHIKNLKPTESFEHSYNTNYYKLIKNTSVIS